MKSNIFPLNSWNSDLLKYPSAHILQSQEWGLIKSKVGWQQLHQTWPVGYLNQHASALILKRSFPLSSSRFSFNILYVPRGPIVDWTVPTVRKAAYEGLEEVGINQNTIFIKIDPDITVRFGPPDHPNLEENPLGISISNELTMRHWIESPDQIQFKNTMKLDLTVDEETLLSRMKQKTRYNIRLAARRGVTIYNGSELDIPMLYDMYAETSVRDGFVIRDKSYYIETWKTFLENNMADIFIATVSGKPVSGLIMYRFGLTAWYMFGMSRDVHRDKMPSYLLQWEAIRHAKKMGCETYDFWGAPNTFDESDPMWGVYRFKSGFGGEVHQTIGAWDRPFKPMLYRFYTKILPRILSIMRKRGMRSTINTLNS